MADKCIRRADLLGKTMDIHSHVGVQIKALAEIGFPYASTIEDLYYRQLAGGVDASVVFPIAPTLYFDIPTFMHSGRLVPAGDGISRSPYERENRLLLTEVFVFCPELKGRFLPFISVDPGRAIPEQLEVLRELDAEFPIYGAKISPVACQSKVTELLGRGAPLLDLFAERGWPVLFHVAVSAGEEFSQASDTLDVVERHPELRFCLAHCIGFHRGFLERADVLPNVWVDTSALKIQVQLAYEESPLMAPPSGRLDCDYSDHTKVMQALVERFPKTIIWGTDAPYHSYITRRLQGEGAYTDFRLKGTYVQEVDALRTLTPEQQRQNNLNGLAFLFGA
jgi:predicted TIM-barrel fold metal-dependent hydrolase